MKAFKSYQTNQRMQMEKIFMYSRENAKAIARKQQPDFLLKAKKTGYVCPKCGNGTGNTGDGILLDKKDGYHYKCFKCGMYADIFELYGLHFGLSDNAEIFKQVYEHYNIRIGNENKKGYHSEKNNYSLKEHKKTPDYIAFFKKATECNDFQYLMKRGISKETQIKFFIGYVPEWKHPKTPNAPVTPRCIIPTSRYSYLARDTREFIPEQQQRYEKSKVGRIEIFNITALDTADVIFITEGEIDAMSIHEASGDTASAIAIGSVAYHNIFMEKIKQKYKNHVFVLMLDNDEPDPEYPDIIPAGQKELRELQNEFMNLNIPFIVAEYDYKDPNEYLIKDPDGMRSTILFLKAKAEHIREGNKYNAAELLDYFRNIESQPYRFEAKTGFASLDDNLNGGLHEGFIVIGAVSGLGKTTFILQLADQIAARGTDVIFFSLEMSKYELMAKSISRHTYEISKDLKMSDQCLAKDTMQILNGQGYKHYGKDEKKIITDAIDAYEKSAVYLYIYEGRYKEKRLTVQHIREIVKQHIHDTGRIPVVMIDYLQMLAPADISFTDKQNIDAAVFELKEISRDYSIPVIAVSSFNRESYLEPVSMLSFKESGAVEYSSDILFGMQYSGMDYIKGEKDSDRKKRIRELKQQAEINKNNNNLVEIELKCLKNRNGRTFTISFDTAMAFNYLKEKSYSNSIQTESEKKQSMVFSQFKDKIPVK